MQNYKYMRMLRSEKHNNGRSHKQEAATESAMFVDSHKFAALHRLSGFTLIETVIYVALFSVVTSFIIVVFFQMIGSEEQHKNRVEVDSEANFLVQKMVWALTGAEAINEPTGGATSSRLSVDKSNYGQNPIVFDVSGRALRIAKASGTPVNLSSGRVFVEKLELEHVEAVQSAPEGVKITLEVKSSDITRPAATTTLVSTIYMR